MQFIKEYTDYASGLSSAPRKFHEMMAYVLLAQVISRRPIYHHSGPPIGPNLWVLVLAPSSTMAKSSALGVGRRILKETYFGELDHLLPIGGSSENFFERLEENPNGIIFNSEFNSLLNWFRLTYASDVMSLLIDCYDQPPEIYKSVGTKHKNNQKKYYIKRPFINAYATSSYSLFNAAMNETLLTGGFLARWIVIREDSEDNFKPFTEKIDSFKEADLSNYLRELLKESPSIDFNYDDSAKKLYSQWFFDYLKPLIRKSSHPLIPSFCLRRNTDIHKIAMILSCTRGGNGIINSQDSDQAITLIQQSIVDTEYVLSERVAFSKDEQEQNKIMEIISTYQKSDEMGAPHWKILKYSRFPAFQFDRVISTLIQANRIKFNEIPTAGRKAIFYSIQDEKD